jgi:hypothetical protein
MAGMNEDGQWIVMLGFIISIILVFLALVVNQSALVGKTTSESVLEFPKSEIQDVRAEILEQNEYGIDEELRHDIGDIALERKGVIISYGKDAASGDIYIHYNDGMTEYDEIVGL